MSVPPESVVPPPSEPSTPSTEGPTHEERQWALLAHLSALIGVLVSGHWFGVACFIGPLVIWLWKKDTLPFVDDQAKEALNFNITLAIIGVVLLVLTVATLGIGALLTIPAGIVIGIAWLVLVIIGAIKANEGEKYRYPFCLRLIK
ncbi:MULTISPECIES: DUF4870 domain-containing protein [Dyella]|uniref:DUF4870 domain-containing protein n=2 Tax=Dyella TaxID=231454 RepID=A0A4V2NMK4_9GAMM|nr:MULTISPECIES: DUF4870 domain-containing protein [Dyella]TBR38742.1 DUF4870 domain-containing protein [Dyella terrae]TCI13667.1 DUF4870 domain-containing protein [Dyella soli]